MSAYSNGFLVVLAFYVTAVILFSLRLVFDRPSLSLRAFRAVFAGFLLQVLFLVFHLKGMGFPYLRGSFEAYQGISAAIILGFLALSFFHRFLTTGVILVPLALGFYVLSLTDVVAYHNPGHFLQNPWAFLHLVFMFIAIAIFVISLGVGLLYLWQEHRIKYKKTGGLPDRFPPLEILHGIHYKALYAGFIFFTVGIIMGGGWSKSTVGVYVTNNLKQVFSLVIWGFFAIFLNLRGMRGWIGRRGVLFSGLGLVGILFLLFWIK